MEIQPQVLPDFIQWVEFGTTLLAVSVLVIIGSVLAYIKWSRRPSFIIGVPPFQAEGIPRGEIGHTSIRDQFRHRKACFAVHLCEKRKLTKRDQRKLFDNRFRRRTLHLSPENSCTIPVVVENRGRRAARDYILVIIFHEPCVHVVDVVRESLDLNAFYCNRIDLVENPELKTFNAPKEIVQAYDNYMGKYGDLVFLTGVLEAGVYEMVLLKIVVEPSVKRFIIGYSLDCSDGWTSKEVFFQGFVIGAESLAPVASEVDQP